MRARRINYSNTLTAKAVRRRRGAAALGARLLLALLAGTAACGGGEEPAVVLAANFFPEPVDLMIGDEPRPVFLAERLGSGAVSPLKEVSACGEERCSYRLAGRTAWQRPPRELKMDKYRITPGAFFALVVDGRGFIRLLRLETDPRPGARLCVLNATDARLASFSAFAQAEEAFPVFRAVDLAPGRATAFRSVVPGRYLLSAAFLAGPGAPAPGSGAPAAGMISCAGDVDCGEAEFWLLYCHTRGGAPALDKHLLARRDEQGRLVLPRPAPPAAKP